MAEIIRLKKGLDIPLTGGLNASPSEDNMTAYVAVVPDDYPGHIWKLSVKSGDTVKKGSPLLFDKETSSIFITSPHAGIVEEIRRGERRHIEAVVIRISESDEQEDYQKQEDAEGIKQLLLQSGLWAMMRQRPYDIVPSPSITPRDIFITAFDSAPLAPELVSPSDGELLEAGIKALSKLTSGKVYLGTRFGSGISSATANVYEFQGPHPAGNVGIQIGALKPVNKGDTVWAIDARTVVRMGRLLQHGTLDMSTDVAITGEEVDAPQIRKTIIGAQMKSLLAGLLKNDGIKKRIISGNVLTGSTVSLSEGFLRYPWRQVTVIPEGDTADEFMGWASFKPSKYSVKRSFPAFLTGLKNPFSFDARIKGGRRAPILSGEIDKVFPMDIYPEFLLKAIRAKDIDRMEQLGIYEVAPEDFALAEFVDTSKEPLQQEVKEGLEYLRKELG